MGARFGHRATWVRRSWLLAAAVLTCPAHLAHCEELIKPTLQVNDVRLVIAFVSTGELANLQHKYGAALDRRDLRQDYRHGLTILKTNRETGERTCEVYLPSSQRPRKVDDEATLTIGHEVLHCMLGDYHR